MPLHPITLVGAGPGDPELLTLKAVRAIAQATVLLVDDLVNDAVLAHAQPSARIVHVGKRGGCRSTPQAFIHRLMVQEARAGERVVRLKGGDPFIFGRGGEEIAHLQAEGLTVAVVNGITAGLAAVTTLGVPLTHRDHAHGVVFITGHAQDPAQTPDWAQLAHTAHPHGVLFITGHAKQDATDAVDWAALSHTAAQAKLTLVIYMGMSGLAHIHAGLRQGLPGTTPVAVVQHATLPEQRELICTLDELPQALAREGLRSPAVIVIGDVFQGLLALRDRAMDTHAGQA